MPKKDEKEEKQEEKPIIRAVEKPKRRRERIVRGIDRATIKANLIKAMKEAKK